VVIRLSSKPKVICFSGSIASGKSSLINKISKLLDTTAIIKFDDYEQFNVFPENIEQWIKDGADASEIKNQRMLTDIQKLIARESAVNPLTEEKIKPAEYILVEDPAGKLRDEFAQLYDFLVFIEIPQDISLARLIKRMINETDIKEDNSADYNKLIIRISKFLDIYLSFQREMYLIICNKVKPSADLLLDGQRTIDELANTVLAKIN
jgi:uridine kinase